MRRLSTSAILFLGLIARTAQATPSTTLVISEFRASGPTGGNDEFVELFNLTNAPFDASGYQIAGSNSGGSTSVRVKLPAGTIIPPRGFLLATNSTSYSGTVAGNVTYTVGVTSDGGVALLDAGGKVVDALGMNAGSAYKEGTTLPSFPSGQDVSYRRKSSNCSPDTDTDNNKNDFDLVNPSTPQDSASCCLDAQCTQVPAGQCYPATGTCNTTKGTCSYAVVPGKTCDDKNACTDSDVCLAGGTCQGTNKVCNTPPAPTCLDAMTQRVFSAVGSCSAGACSYSTVDSSCACNVATGLCQDPCAGVTCTTPPNTQCYAATGSCSPLTGSCSYTKVAPGTACDDGALCTSGDACDASGACSGTPRVCTPPGPECVAGASRTYSGGACNPGTGVCSFQQADSPCSFGCDGTTGLCKGNPCAGVSCTTPPGACYQAIGVCDTGSGQCVYTPKPGGTACDDGASCTDSDVCNGAGTCAGSTRVCSPPPPVCVAGASRTYSGGSCAPGTGVCSFQQTDAPCASGCDAATGLCKNDPCAGITCNQPPSQCYQSTGSCAAGQCSYALKPENAQCDDGDACTGPDRCTASGACVGATTVCNTPPAPKCTSPKTSTSYIPVGMCAAGQCSYTPLANDCAFGCDMDTGLCVGDPCAGVTCTTPPSGCHSSIGSCANGVCSYGLKQAGAACDDGDVCTSADACTAAGLCQGAAKVCGSPPAPVCLDAKTSRSAAPMGACKPDGTCDYVTSDTPCALGCDAATGLCSSDQCAAVTCNQPPSPCHAPMGTCMAGQCTYPLLQPGAACNDGNPCTVNDACNANGDCAGVAKACNTPPDPECASAKESQSSSPTGTCSPIDGSCGYDTTTTKCAVSCDLKTGLCLDDPCAGVVCNKPPNACHLAVGQCTKGLCSYSPQPTGTGCDDGDSCTTGDACDAQGSCKGAATPGCGAAGSAGAAGKGGAAGGGGAAGKGGASAGGAAGSLQGGAAGKGGAGASGKSGAGSSGKGGAGSSQGGADGSQGGDGGATDEVPAPSGASAPGCGCAVPGQDTRAPSALGALALGLVAGLRRARRRAVTSRSGRSS